MSHHRYAKRRDIVHAPIVAGLRERGVVVFEMLSPADVLCFWPASNLWMPMELKSDNSIRKKRKDGGDMISNNKMKDQSLAIIPMAHTLQAALGLLGIEAQ